MNPQNRKDLIGQRFGRLLVTAFANSRSGKLHWQCRCECGAERVVCGESLRRGVTLSCGCLHREISTSHGGSYSPEYEVWRQARARCTVETHRAWEHYGGRGIRMCAEWEHDFAAFLAHIGPRPTALHSLDRIDNDGNYEPGNVRWATEVEQGRNRRTTIAFRGIDDEPLSLQDVANFLAFDDAQKLKRLFIRSGVLHV